MRIFSSGLNLRRVLRLISRTVFSTALWSSCFCLVFVPFSLYDEPKTPPYQFHPSCPTWPDRVQASLHAFQLSPAPSDTSTRSAFLKRYCVTCHNDRLNTAGFSLERYEPDQVGQDAPIWEKVAHKLRAREMPPAGAPRPTGPSYDAMVHYL